MEERIEINGVWYVREDLIESKLPPHFELIHYHGIVVENDSVCLELTITVDDEGKPISDPVFTPMLEVTTKRGDRRDWIKETWDSDEYLMDICIDKKDKELKNGGFDEEDIALMKEIILEAKDMGWFDYYFLG